MGKYLYQDGQNKWRVGDDTDDFFVGLLIAALFCLGWVFWKPISWWVLKREQPTDGWITVWIIVSIALFSLIIYLCTL